MGSPPRSPCPARRSPLYDAQQPLARREAPHVLAQQPPLPLLRLRRRRAAAAARAITRVPKALARRAICSPDPPRPNSTIVLPRSSTGGSFDLPDRLRVSARISANVWSATCGPLTRRESVSVALLFCSAS